MKTKNVYNAFRAWDILEKKMVYDGVALTTYNTVLYRKYPGEWIMATERFIVMHAIPKIIDGNQVYVGDVVLRTGYGTNDKTIVVDFDTILPDKETVPGDHNDGEWTEEYTYKIIGNIYENKELRVW